MIPLAPDLVPGINLALNESEVAGLRIADDQSRIDLLLHVSALPEIGPLDPDARRAIALWRPSRIQVLLRQRVPEGYGAVMPLGGVEEVNSFLLSVTWSDNMYGWPFLDGSEDATSKWPDPISLDLRFSDGEADHSLYWYAECGWNRDEGYGESFFIQGMIRFGELEVRHADDAIVPLDDFIADGRRPWDAMHTHDDRISAEAQRIAQTGTPRWRYWPASD